MLGKAILHTGATDETEVQTLVALAVEINFLAELVGPVSEVDIVTAFPAAVQPVTAVDTSVDESAHLLSAKAERCHHGQLKVVVDIPVVSRFLQRANDPVVLLDPVQFGTNAQPVVDIVLSHHTEGYPPTVLVLIVNLVMFVDDVVIHVCTNVGTDAPLGKCQRGQ